MVGFVKYLYFIRVQPIFCIFCTDVALQRLVRQFFTRFSPKSDRDVAVQRLYIVAVVVVFVEARQCLVSTSIIYTKNPYRCR